MFPLLNPFDPHDQKIMNDLEKNRRQKIGKIGRFQEDIKNLFFNFISMLICLALFSPFIIGAYTMIRWGFEYFN